MALKVLISAGEVSGDQHLARVIRALKASLPNVVVRGMGGQQCKSAGAELIVDCYRSGAAMGFLELARSASKIFSSFRAMSTAIKSWRPDVLVLVDYPDFNLRLAKVAHAHGVKVLYYIPPKIWAWRSGRIKKIARYVDQVATIFPFEREFYIGKGYSRAVYVGHPLSELVLAAENTPPRPNTLLLLPGSRRFELERLLVPMLRAYGLLRKKRPDLKAQVVLAPNVSSEWAKGLVGGKVADDILTSIEWRNVDAIEAMKQASVGVLKSGTCNLEGAMAGLPFISVYSGTIVAKVIVSLLVPFKEYSPVNIMKAHTVRELMQTKLSEHEVAAEVERILDDPSYRQRMVNDLSEVREKLFSADAVFDNKDGASTVSQRVATMIVNMGQRSVV